mgnify:CR=1 FL=1
MVLTGDLNIAPLETDVWSHERLKRVITHTPIERDRLKAMMAGNVTQTVEVLRPHLNTTLLFDALSLDRTSASPLSALMSVHGPTAASSGESKVTTHSRLGLCALGAKEKALMGRCESDATLLCDSYLPASVTTSATGRSTRLVYSFGIATPSSVVPT